MPGYWAQPRSCKAVCACAQELSSVWLCSPMNIAHQAPLSMRILQTRIVERVAISSSRGSSPPRDGTCVSCIVGRFFTTRETLVLIYTHVILFYKQKSLCNIIIYSLNAQWVKNPPAVRETQETQVWSLGGEDPLEKEIATHSSILAFHGRRSLATVPVVSKEWDRT